MVMELPETLFVPQSLYYVPHVSVLPSAFFLNADCLRYIRRPNPYSFNSPSALILIKIIYSEWQGGSELLFYGIWRRVNGTGIPMFWRNSAFIYKGIEVGQNKGTLLLQNLGNRLSSDVSYPRQTDRILSYALQTCVCEKFEYKPTKH